MKLNPNKKSKTKQNLVLGTEQSIEFEERIKWRVWRRGRLAWLALSLSLSHSRLLPQIQGPTQKTKALERTYRDLGWG